MQIETTTDARVEIDYGLLYMKKALAKDGRFDSRELAISFTHLEEGRMYLGRFLTYAGANNKGEIIPENKVIEPATDKVDPNTVSADLEKGAVFHVKTMMIGVTTLINKTLEVRMKPLGISNPNHQFMATQSLNSAIEHFEAAYMWLESELQRIKLANPELYTDAVEKKQEEDESPKQEEAETTNAIMEERAIEAKEKDPENVPVEEGEGEMTEEDPNRPLTGADFLPGGRAYEGPEDTRPEDINKDGIVDEKDLSEVHKAYHEEKKEEGGDEKKSDSGEGSLENASDPASAPDSTTEEE